MRQADWFGSRLATLLWLASVVTLGGAVIFTNVGTPAKVFYWIVVAFAWTAGLIGLLRKRKA